MFDINIRRSIVSIFASYLNYDSKEKPIIFVHMCFFYTISITYSIDWRTAPAEELPLVNHGTEISSIIFGKTTVLQIKV
jgi:hypothetical protein